jgi:hypothetical protein
VVCVLSAPQTAATVVCRVAAMRIVTPRCCTLVMRCAIFRAHGLWSRRVRHARITADSVVLAKSRLLQESRLLENCSQQSNVANAAPVARTFAWYMSRDRAWDCDSDHPERALNTTFWGFHAILSNEPILPSESV